MSAMTEQPALEFAALLRQLRAQVKLTQEELAEAAGLSTRTVSDLERRFNRTAHKDTAGLLADALCLAEPVRALFIAAARGRAPAAAVLAALADAGADHGHSLAGVALPTWLARPGTDRLAGRQDELRSIGTAVNDALAGSQRAVLVAGEPGIGKTRLASEAALTARDRGMLVLAGRCDPDVAAAYGPFTEALRQAVAGIDDTQTLGRYLGQWPGELMRVVPEFVNVSGFAPPLASDPDTERWRLFDAVVSALASLGATDGLMLVIDDLQWAARPTLALLRHLLRSELPLRLMLLTTYRVTDIDIDRAHPLATWVSDIQRIPGVTTLQLGGLNEIEMGQLVAAKAGHNLDAGQRNFVSWLCRETAGNALFADQVLRRLTETGDLKFSDDGWHLTTSLDTLKLPEGIREVIWGRLNPLGELVNQVLTAGAIIGFEFNLEVVAAVLGATEDHCLDALERAAAARLVTEAGADRWRFVHALVRSTLYDGLSASRRARRHRQVAQILEASPPGDSLALANHWSLAAGRDAPARACEWLRYAGDEAMGRLAPDQAAVFYTRVLDIDTKAGEVLDAPDRVAVTIALGTAQRLMGDAAYRKTLLDAAEIASRLNDAKLLAEAAVANSRGFWSVAGEVDTERTVVLEKALAALPLTDSRLRARILANLAAELLFSPDRNRRFSLSDEALAVARRLGDDQALFDALFTRIVCTNTPARVSTLWTEAQELLPLAARVGDPGREVNAALVWYATATYVGEFEEADKVLSYADRLTRELRQPTLRWVSAAHRAGRPLLAGRLAEAEAIAGEALSYGQEAGEQDAFIWYGAQLAIIRRDQGRLDELIDAVAQLTAGMPQASAWQAFLAVGYCELDRLDEARAVFERLAAHGFQAMPYDHHWLLGMSLAADACVWLGTKEHAQALYSQLRPWAQQFAGAGIFSIGCVERPLGILAGTMGKHDLAETHLIAAVEENERIDSPVWASTARLDLADLLLARGRRGDADRSQQLIRDALTRIRGLGAARVEKRAARLLKQLAR
jgi:transcriptional regulator with XRE-family HTH domain/tetratricopeptide (TPR) repeat protein